MQPNDAVESYVNQVCEQVRCKKAHEGLKKELHDHIEDQTQFNLTNGMEQDEAINKAIESMGDAIMVGGQLDRTHRPKPAWGLIVMVIGLVFIGFILQSLIMCADKGFVYVIFESLKSFINIAPFAIGAMLIGYLMDFTLWGKYPKTIFAVLVAMCILFMMKLPTAPGSYSYTCYIMLLFVPAYAGMVYHLRDKGYLGILLCGVVFIVPAFITINIRITAFLMIVLIALTILTIVVIKGWFNVKRIYAILLIWIPTVATIGIFLATTHVFERIKVVLFNSSETNNYIDYIVKTALESANFIGKATDLTNTGLENFRLYRTKEMFKTNVITNLIIEYGYLIALLIVALLIGFIVLMVIKTFKTKSSLGFIISLSCTMLFGLEITAYLLENFGLMNLFQNELPFMTHGKASLIAHMFLIGIMLSIFKYKDILKQESKEEQTKKCKSKLFEWIDKKILSH